MEGVAQVSGGVRWSNGDMLPRVSNGGRVKMQKHHGWPTEPSGTATPVMAALLSVRHWHTGTLAHCDQTAASHWDAVHRDACL